MTGVRPTLPCYCGTTYPIWLKDWDNSELESQDIYYWTIFEFTEHTTEGLSIWLSSYYVIVFIQMWHDFMTSEMADEGLLANDLIMWPLVWMCGFLIVTSWTLWSRAGNCSMCRHCRAYWVSQKADTLGQLSDYVTCCGKWKCWGINGGNVGHVLTFYFVAWRCLMLCKLCTTDCRLRSLLSLRGCKLR